MNSNTKVLFSPFHYSLAIIKDEVKQLVEQGIIKRNQPLYVLCQYLPAREWLEIECELERCDYFLRDRVGDLLSTENWDSD